MEIDLINEQIEHLEELKRKVLEGTLDKKDLNEIYGLTYSWHNVLKCSATSAMVFYYNNEGQWQLIKELEPYKTLISNYISNYRKTMGSLAFVTENRMGAGVLNYINGQYNEVYPPE